MILFETPKPAKTISQKPEYTDLVWDEVKKKLKCTRTTVEELLYEPKDIEEYTKKQAEKKVFNEAHNFPELVVVNDVEIGWGQQGLTNVP